MDVNGDIVAKDIRDSNDNRDNDLRAEGTPLRQGAVLSIVD